MDNLPDNCTDRDIDEAGQVPQPSDEALEGAAKKTVTWHLDDHSEIGSICADDAEVIGYGDGFSMVVVATTVKVRVNWGEV